MRNIILAFASAFVLTMTGVSLSNAGAVGPVIEGVEFDNLDVIQVGCVNRLKCGVEGRKFRAAPGVLNSYELELAKRKRVKRVRASDCVFVEFKGNGSSAPAPIGFAPDGEVFGCPQQRSWNCINCTAFCNNKIGGGYAAGPVSKNSTGMWVPKKYVNLWAWCPQIDGSWSTYRPKGRVSHSM